MRCTRAIRSQLLLGTILGLTTLFSSIAAQAASISYGNFGPVPPGVTFLDVQESSGTDPVPLYGPPTPFSVGLNFKDPTFTSSASGGSLDLTDGQLNFTVMSQVGPNGGFGINGLNLSEGGDFHLLGVGTTATSVVAGAIIHASVTQIDGIPVAPIVLSPSNASVGFNLVANPGMVQPWSLGTSIVVPPMILPNGNPAKFGATKIDVVINNSLASLSEAQSIAFIAKKRFQIGIVPGPGGDIPEPATVVLLGLAISVMGLVSRRGR